MASNLKKASSLLRKSFRSRRRYASFECKENMDLATTSTFTSTSRKTSRKSDGNLFAVGEERYRSRTLSTSACSSSDENERNLSLVANPGSPSVQSQTTTWLRRGTSMTQSMRDAVGTIKQKLRMSTRRGRQRVTSRVGARRHTVGGHSPFKASTPSRSDHIKPCLSKETPTRLKREVESLTSNMQALNALTPNTLEVRPRMRRSTPLTNGSLKTPRAIRKHVVTDIC